MQAWWFVEYKLWSALNMNYELVNDDTVIAYYDRDDVI